MAIKYLWRAKYKNGIEDLEKALWSIQREIDRLKAPRENRMDKAAEKIAIMRRGGPSEQSPCE